MCKFSIGRFKNSEDHFRFFTGIPSYAVFKAFFDTEKKVIEIENYLQKEDFCWGMFSPSRDATSKSPFQSITSISNNNYSLLAPLH